MGRSRIRLILIGLILAAASLMRPLTAQAAPQPSTLCVAVEQARVRTGPSLDSAVIKIKSRLDPIRSLGTVTGGAVGSNRVWHAVEVLNAAEPGYMHASVLSPCPEQSALATAPPVAPAPEPPAPTLAPEAERVAHGATVRLLLLRGDGTVVQGTGTMIGADGLTFLTAFHVIGNPLTGTPYGGTLRVGPYLNWTLEARLLAFDPSVDMALLRVVHPQGLFSVVPLGDSEALRAGDAIHVLSYPAEGAGSLVRSSGRVLGHFLFEGYGVPLIATDADASLGSSGGVAINGRGEVVGIVTGLVVSPRGMARLGRADLTSATLIVPISAARPLLAEASVTRASAVSRGGWFP